MACGYSDKQLQGILLKPLSFTRRRPGRPAGNYPPQERYRRCCLIRPIRSDGLGSAPSMDTIATVRLSVEQTLRIPACKEKPTRFIDRKTLLMPLV